jgi:DNA-directed RNA polymerase alpha subunit
MKMSDFMVVYNIISHSPQNPNLNKAAKVRVADSYADEQTAKDALFDLMVEDFDAAQREGTDLINKRSYSLQKMAVHLASTKKSVVPNTSYNPHLLTLVADCLDLTVRARNGLLRGGCVTVSDIIKKNKRDLLKIENFGMRSYHEVVEWLGDMNLAINHKN